MLLVVPFCHKDAKQAVKLLDWMFELDGRITNHRCLAVGAKGIKDELAIAVEEAAHRAFVTSKMVRTTVVDERGWPQSCNTLFTCASLYIRDTLKCPFWWNEPDCVPIKKGWLDDIEAEYAKARKPFMGSIVHKPCTHLTGCALYPPDIGFYNHKLLGTNNPIAWDCIAPELTLQHTHHTNLFQHCWDHPKTGKVATFPDQESLSFLRPDAVVFHRNKDLTLIDRLRERLNTVTPPKAPITETPPTTPVYTYYEDIGRKEESELIEQWRLSWASHGWFPVVLGNKEFEMVGGHMAFLSAAKKLPTINKQEYELACYKRWFVMGGRGGVMTDYDVMNYGFTPDMAVKSHGSLKFLEHGIPSVVIGSARQYRKFCGEISNYSPCIEDKINGNPHVSDMFIVQRLWDQKQFSHQPVVVQYTESGWEKALLVHYPNSRTKGNKLSAIKQRPIK